jgi:ATP-dependent Clp protease adaptor protein ClpS
MAIPQHRPFEQPEEVTVTETSGEGGYAIVLYNDEVNSFEHVINCLTELCGHTPEQAEQCAWIVHHKGKYAVMLGSYEELAPVCDALCLRGLSAVVEEV